MPRSSDNRNHRDGRLSKGEETRRMILKKALAMATTQGLEGLSIGSVAKAVGMSKSGLFAHFESKEELQLQVLQTAVEYWINRVAAPAIRVKRGEPRVRALFDNWFDWERSTLMPGGCIFISSATELDARPGPLRDYLKSTQHQALDALATAASLGVKEGHFRADLDCQQFAHDLYSIMLAFHHFHHLLDDPKAVERSRKSFEDLLMLARIGAPSPLVAEPPPSDQRAQTSPGSSPSPPAEPTSTDPGH